MDRLVGWEIGRKFHDIVYDLEGISDEEAKNNCLEALELYYWGGKEHASCPKAHPGGATVKELHLRRRVYPPRYKCHDCGKQFNIFHGTVFAGSRIPLIKWFKALEAISQRKPIRKWAKELGLQYRDAQGLRAKIRKLGKTLGDNALFKIAQKWMEKKIEGR